MRVRHGTFSYLAPLTDQEILAQIDYAVGNGWSVAIEFTDDPHPRNVYWEMWGMPSFDIESPDVVLQEVLRCRDAFPDAYVRVTGFDPSLGRQTTALSFLVNRPKVEPHLRLERSEGAGRRIGYSLTRSP